MPRIRLLTYCEYHIDQHTGNSVRTWMTFYKLLRSFEIYQSHINYKLMSDSFCKNTVSVFINYLFQEKNYTQNTVYNNFNMLRSMLYQCHADGYAVDVMALKRTSVKPGEPFAVYLTMEELKKLEELPLTNTLENIRDHFLISCYTGLRFQDLTWVKPANITENVIAIGTQKTAEKVMIPMHPVVKKIMRKYEDGVPLDFTGSYFNTKIKQIAEEAGITELITVTDVRQKGKPLVKTLPKANMIASRTGRRTFATNMYLLNPQASVYPIMLITGHKTEESFFKYIRLTKLQNAQQLLGSHPFFTGKKSTDTEAKPVKYTIRRRTRKFITSNQTA
jgi:site-specific recombinase XerD